jgi:hypothetical protein
MRHLGYCALALFIVGLASDASAEMTTAEAGKASGLVREAMRL